MIAPPRRHQVSELESGKFELLREDYYLYMNELKDMGYDFEDFIHYFPCFAGKFTLVRFISLIECFQGVRGLAGHIADVGMFKGASSLLFAKLLEIYEPHSLTQVHGFDWFKANKPGPKDPYIVPGQGEESESRLRHLVKLQKLEHVLKIHSIDLAHELPAFFSRYQHLKFKLVFMDCGIYEVVKASLPFFWDRLVPDGIMVFDQYNFDSAVGETLAVDEFFREIPVKIETFRNGWMPTAFVRKPVDKVLPDVSSAKCLGEQL